MFNKALHDRWLRMAALLAGSFLAAWTVNTFIVPCGLYSGGILGLSQVIRTVLNTYFGIGSESIDLAGALYLAANVPLLILAYRSLGHTFVFKLIFCTVCNSVFMTLLPVPAQPVIDDILTSCLIAGLLNGLAMGLVLTCGGSTGGLDILGLYLSKTKGLTAGQITIVFNVFLYLLCLLLFDTETVIYSAIFSMLTSVFIDKMHQQNITAQAIIITKEDDGGLPDAIMKSVARGVTFWEGRGAYTGDGVRILCVCLSKYEIETLQRTVQEIDPNAFMMVQEGVQTAGNFKRHLV